MSLTGAHKMLMGEGAPLDWTAKVVDTFTESSDTALASHTPDTDVEAGGWSVKTGMTWQANAAADQLHCRTTDNRGYAVIDLGAEDMRCRMTYTSFGTSVAEWTGFVIRHDGDLADATADYLVITPVDDPAGTIDRWRLDGVVNGSKSNISGGTWQPTSTTFLDGDTITVEVRAIGNLIQFRFPDDAPNDWYDWTLTGADATNFGAGCGHTYAGVWSARNLVQVQGTEVDTWSGWTL